MASESRIQDKDIPNLSQFVVPNVHPTGRELGRGAYGSVEEVEIPGAVCAAKKIHDELLRVGSSEDKRHMIDAFVRECKLMSSLRHPHIVQFLGVCYLAGSKLPSLIMERLDMSLHEFLESTPDLLLTTKQSVLLDVARGLLYLHSQTPPIIHRDLTARNVLLNSSLAAKITDMGVARIVNLRSDQLAATMTRGPGNITYMPPEAMGPHSKYDTSLDVFSFGNLILFTLTQQFPNLLAATYSDPNSDKVIGRTETERRSNEFQLANSLLGSKHPLIDLSRNCLQNRATNRPTTSQLVTRVTETLESSLPSRLELEKEIATERTNNTLLKDNNKALQEQATSLQEMIVAKQGVVDEQLEELKKKNEQILELQGQLDQQQEQVKTIEKKIDQLLMQANVPHGELKRLQSEVDKLKVMKHELEFPISFEWERLKDKPTDVSDFFSSPVVLNGEVYLEGTFGTIHQYTPSSDAWTNLRKCPILSQGIVALNSKLIVIGNGLHVVDGNGVATWSSETHKWICSHPPLPTERYCPAAIGYKNFIIVAGGVPSDKLLQSTTTVEVLDADSGKWHKAPPMPYNGSNVASAVIGQHLYLHLGMRGSLTASKSILKVSLPTLISHTLAGKNRDTSIWEKLPDVPFYNSTLFSIGNMLLSAGGTPAGTAGALANAIKIKGYKVVSDIYLFNPFTNQWVKVGDLPEPQFDCICVAYSPDKLLLVGGDIGLKKKTSAVYTATISRFHF